MKPASSGAAAHDAVLMCAEAKPAGCGAAEGASGAGSGAGAGCRAGEARGAFLAGAWAVDVSAASAMPPN